MEDIMFWKWKQAITFEKWLDNILKNFNLKAVAFTLIFMKMDTLLNWLQHLLLTKTMMIGLVTRNLCKQK